jgi:hypothetical protein
MRTALGTPLMDVGRDAFLITLLLAGVGTRSHLIGSFVDSLC